MTYVDELRDAGPGTVLSQEIAATVDPARHYELLPCVVHMYLGGGKTLKQRHSPMFGHVDG